MTFPRKLKNLYRGKLRERVGQLDALFEPAVLRLIDQWFGLLEYRWIAADERPGQCANPHLPDHRPAGGALLAAVPEISFRVSTTYQTSFSRRCLTI